MEALRENLGGHQNDQRSEENRRSGEIAPIQGHGHRIPTRLAERGGGDLDDPEDESDLRDLCERVLRNLGLEGCHGSTSKLHIANGKTHWRVHGESSRQAQGHENRRAARAWRIAVSVRIRTLCLV